MIWLSFAANNSHLTVPGRLYILNSLPFGCVLGRAIPSQWSPSSALTSPLFSCPCVGLSLLSFTVFLQKRISSTEASSFLDFGYDWLCISVRFCQVLAYFYVSPSSREAYRDRQLTLDIFVTVDIFCVLTRFTMRIPKPCRLSICQYPENRNHPGFVSISPSLVIDTSMERSSRVLQHGNTKIWIFELKLNFDLCWRAEITLDS